MKFSLIHIYLTFILSIIILSCKDNRSPLQYPSENIKGSIETKPDPKELEYYSIKLNHDQIKKVGQTRILTLTNEQSNYLKNKVKKIKVTGANSFVPDGWFNPQWVKPNEVVIKKYMIDDFENMEVESITDITDFDTKAIVINISIEGDYYLKNKKCSIDDIQNEIIKIENKFGSREIGVYISLAPIENKKILDEVLLKNTLIEDYTKNKNIHFQNDW